MFCFTQKTKSQLIFETQNIRLLLTILLFSVKYKTIVFDIKWVV